MSLFAVIIPVLLVGVLYAGVYQGFLLRLTPRPLLVTAAALALGLLWNLTGLPELPDKFVRILSEALLGGFVFAATLACRLPRLRAMSPEAFRLSTAGMAFILLGFTATAFVLVPGLGLYPPLLVGAALMLGGGASPMARLLNAPVEDSTKMAAQLEPPAVLAIGIPVAMMLGAGAMPVLGEVTLLSLPTVRAVIGFAGGGIIGLVAARLFGTGEGELPLTPFLVGAAAYLLAALFGFSPVMATAAAGLAYSADVRLPTATRIEYWRTGEALLTPAALIVFGLFVAPMAATLDFLVWFMALVTVGLIRGLARYLVLAGSNFALADRTFLTWVNGAPGAVSGLMMVYMIAIQAPLGDRVIALAAVSILLGIISTRLLTRPLTRRLVQQTALARKQQRYSPV